MGEFVTLPRNIKKKKKKPGTFFQKLNIASSSRDNNHKNHENRPGRTLELSVTGFANLGGLGAYSMDRLSANMEEKSKVFKQLIIT